METQQYDQSIYALREGGRKFQSRVSNPTVFRAYMLAKWPTLGITGAYLASLNADRSEVYLPYAWNTRDLFGTLSHAALWAAAEVASVSLLVLHIRNQEAPLTPELLHFEGDLSMLEEKPEKGLRLACINPTLYPEFVSDGRQAVAQGEAIDRVFEVGVLTAENGATEKTTFRNGIEVPQNTAHATIQFRWRLRAKD